MRIKSMFFAILSIVVLIIGTLLATGCGYGIRNAQGVKIGQIVKLGEYGVFCTTYEGELVRGGFGAGSGVNGAAFHFTVIDRDVFLKMTEAMEKQQEVEITYEKTFMASPCNRAESSEAFVRSFRIINNQKEIRK